jgi:hypothetical protein
VLTSTHGRNESFDTIPAKQVAECIVVTAFQTMRRHLQYIPQADARAVSGFRLLRGGCRVPLDGANVTVYSLSFPAPVAMDGFDLLLTSPNATAAAARDTAPPRFVVTTGPAGGPDSRAVVGAAAFRFVAGGVRFLTGRGAAGGAPRDGGVGGGVHSFDYRPPWPLITSVTVGERISQRIDCTDDRASAYFVHAHPTSAYLAYAHR